MQSIYSTENAPKILFRCEFVIYGFGGPIRAFPIERDVYPVEEAFVCAPPKKQLPPCPVDGAGYSMKSIWMLRPSLANAMVGTPTRC
jgi:hypothetical protein